LATVYGIVKQSHAHITVYSEPGLGSTFKIYFPSLDKSVLLPTARQHGTAPRGDGTILLVEDEAPLRVLAAESLKRLGYTILQAGNGLEALAVADQHPGKVDMVDKLRQKREGFAVIFMSGYTDAAALENAKIGAGAILLSKPFSSELLARKISEVQQNAVDPNSKALAPRNAG
jgi:two-component system cell cycle sensor histidine kinase/response regulator CckA